MPPDATLTTTPFWPALPSLLLSLLGYLLGSVLPAEWLSRRRLGRALQDIGENPGTSAAWRVLGARAGLLVVAFDLLKGAVPYLLAEALRLPGAWLVLPSLAPVVGHNWPLGRPRRGGHGLAAGGGVLFSAGWPVMVYGAPLGVTLMVWAGYPADAIAVVVAVLVVLAVRLVLDRRATGGPQPN